MALLKTGEVLGFPTDMYIKIAGVNIVETGANESGKLYTVSLLVNFYTNATKEYSFKQASYNFNGYQSQTFTVAEMYTLLKTNEDFAGVQDV